MNIVVIGPGALGSLFGARLALGDRHVTLLDHDGARAGALANQLTLHRNHRQEQVELAITADPACLQQADLVLLTVKAQQVGDLLAVVRSRTRPPCLIIGLQNGISHLPFFAESAAGLALGVTSQGATLLAPGHVRHGGDGPTSLGFLQPATTGQNASLARAAALLTAAGLPAQVVDDIENRLWQKLLVNAGINGLTVLHDCANGRLLEIAEARSRLRALVAEGVVLARRKGIDVGADPVARTLEVCRATAANISSMLQDVRNGRPTEIMAINGALVAAAEELAMPAPENALLITEVLAAEKAARHICHESW
ncbi:MAG: 2-dehydropantoate 2-reductase [Desulfurivibrionaceae bacterium]|nr:2-dehydropantoate 2-reductase [Desulfurivibrionaceae bacterium]